MFRLCEDPKRYGLPRWLNQLSSVCEDRFTTLWQNFEREDAEPTKDQTVEDMRLFCVRHRVEEVVECMPLDLLLSERDFDCIDLLQIDAEGYDREVMLTRS